MKGFTSISLLTIFLLISSPVFAGDKATVQYVSDGDTIAVKLNGVKEKVRLIGIDTPESRVNDKTLRDSNRSGADIETIISQGKKATTFVKSVLHKGNEVTLKYDVERRDRYGRLLAYVYLGDGRMLNDVIIGNGYAAPLTIAPNVKYKDRFLKSYQNARNKKLGLWAN